MNALAAIFREEPLIYCPSNAYAEEYQEKGSDSEHSYYEFVYFVSAIDEDTLDAMALADASPSFDFLRK